MSPLRDISSATMAFPRKSRPNGLTVYCVLEHHCVWRYTDYGFDRIIAHTDCHNSVLTSRQSEMLIYLSLTQKSFHYTWKEPSVFLIYFYQYLSRSIFTIHTIYMKIEYQFNLVHSVTIELQ